MTQERIMDNIQFFGKVTVEPEINMMGLGLQG